MIGLIALAAFWCMVGKIWIEINPKLALIFAGLWIVFYLLVLFFNFAPYFIITEALMVILMIFIEKANSP